MSNKWQNDDFDQDDEQPGFQPLRKQSGKPQTTKDSRRQQAKEWDRRGMPPLRFAVNLSARQFSHPDVVERIREAVTSSGFDARRLELELTESTSMRDPEISIEVMHRLREMGLRLAIDDFGTGYSNLSYLKRFPVHALKLDRAFVKEITSDPDDFAISRAVVAIASTRRV